jgi:hypothetical protein
MGLSSMEVYCMIGMDCIRAGCCISTAWEYPDSVFTKVFAV